MSAPGEFSFLATAHFLEIYNERIYDLLDSATPAVNLREDVSGRVYVDGAIEQDIADPVAAAKIIEKGSRHRHVAATSMKLFALLSFLPAAAALGYCNDKDLSCAAWGKAGECTGTNSEVVKEKCPHTCGVCTHICSRQRPSSMTLDS